MPDEPSDVTGIHGAARTQGELGEPKLIPLDDPTVLPEGGAQGAPQQTPQSGGQPPQEEGLDNWKNQALQHREKAQRFQTYEGLISYLENNPKAVGDLEQMILRGATSLAASEDLAAQGDQGGEPLSDEELLAQEFGAQNEGTPQQAQGRQPQVSQDELVRRAREEGAAAERARLKFQEFQQDLNERGVPEHAIDEFVQFMQNPGALTYNDLFQAYNSNRVSNGKEPINVPPQQTPQVAHPPSQGQPVQQGQGQEPSQPRSPVPVQAMAGESNKPDANRYQPNEGDDEKYVVNPNEI